MNPAVIPLLELASIRSRQLADALRHAQAGGVPPTHSEVSAQIAALQRMVAEAAGYAGQT